MFFKNIKNKLKQQKRRSMNDFSDFNLQDLKEFEKFRNEKTVTIIEEPEVTIGIIPTITTHNTTTNKRQSNQEQFELKQINSTKCNQNNCSTTCLEYITLTCNHTFHIDCIVMNLNENEYCPINECKNKGKIPEYLHCKIDYKSKKQITSNRISKLERELEMCKQSNLLIENEINELVKSTCHSKKALNILINYF